MLATAAIVLAPGWGASARLRRAVAGAVAGALVCTNQNRGLWLILWLVVALPALVIARREPDRWRRCLRELAWTALGGVAVCVPVFGHAVWRSSLADVLYATYTWVIENYRTFHVGKVAWSATFFAPEHAPFANVWLSRSMPLILAIEAASLLWAIWSRGLRAQIERSLLLMLAVFAVISILYYPDVIHVAFVTPFCLVVIAGMVYRARTALQFMEAPIAVGAARVAWVVVVAMVFAKGWTNAELARMQNPNRVETAFGTMALSDGRLRLLEDLRDHLASTPDASPNLFTYQSEAWLYLALPADNPTPFSLLKPVYNTPAQIEEAIARLERDPDARVLTDLFSLFATDDSVVQYLRAQYPALTGVGETLQGMPTYYVMQREPQ